MNVKCDNKNYFQLRLSFSFLCLQTTWLSPTNFSRKMIKKIKPIHIHTGNDKGIVQRHLPEIVQRPLLILTHV